MSEYTHILVRRLTPAELDLVKILTPVERATLLLEAAYVKAAQVRSQVRSDASERTTEGEETRTDATS